MSRATEGFSASTATLPDSAATIVLLQFNGAAVLRSWNHVPFADELRQLLPADLPFREECIAGAARHLDLIVEANRHFNLTRIVNPREAAIKHVADSVLPWRLFAGADHVADAGSGAGFPGVPLALVLPQTRFTLLESTRKKACFLESVVRELALPNVAVRAERAEEWLNTHRVAIVTARAVAPLHRAASLFAPALRSGARVLLYKGPDAATEIAEAAPETAKRRLRMRIVARYELPARGIACP
jgi:16S rRNA (guanine527-N7)-methyltransferase